VHLRCRSGFSPTPLYAAFSRTLSRLFNAVVDEIRRDTRRLRVEDCVVALCMQQHLVQTPEHAVRLQQLRTLCFDPLLLWSSR
jgi:hypothetical protein